MPSNKNTFWEVIRKLKRSYSRIAGYHDNHGKGYGKANFLVYVHDAELNRKHFTKYLPPALNVAKKYMDGVDEAHHEVKEIRSHVALVRGLSTIHVPRVPVGCKRVDEIYCYKLTITADNYGYRHVGRHIRDTNGALAHLNIYQSLQLFRKWLTQHHSQYRLMNTRIRNKYYRQLHVHGLVLSSRNDVTATKRVWEKKFSQLVGYTVSLKLQPVQDYFAKSDVVLSLRHRNPKTYYMALFQYLRYINRSWKLACPNPQHPMSDWLKWKRLPYSEKRQYVLNTLHDTKSSKVRVNYNYNLHRVDEEITTTLSLAYIFTRIESLKHAVRAEADRQASADQHYYFVGLNRWAQHRKHLTSIEQWKSLTSGKPYAAGKKTEQLSLLPPRPAQIAVPVDLIEAGTDTYIYSIHVTELISHAEYITTETNDRTRHTGIPP